MASFYCGTVDQFLTENPANILARLAIEYANRGYTAQYSEQTLTWQRDIVSLQSALARCVLGTESAKAWGLLLEFSIPRKEMRIDVALLVRDVIVLLEAKTGLAESQAKRQIEEYALLLRYFHKESRGHRIVPIMVSPKAIKADLRLLGQREIFPQLSTYWIAPVTTATWDDLSNLLIALDNPAANQLIAQIWNESPYFPIPSILEAAVALKSGLSIREIAHSEASKDAIENVRLTVQGYVQKARAESHHAICFLTGVPGSGKTLVGLSLAHSNENKIDAIHFMSGNGPLVKVLQYLFTKESMRRGAMAMQARTEAKTLIENVHVFAKYYTDENPEPPSNHAIIFDEAQRAWNRHQHMKRFKRDYSEPEMLLRVMERHPDWAIVVALVGGGQEINDGEAGLEEWGRALISSAKSWVIYASPEVLEGGASTAGHRLFEDSFSRKDFLTSAALHLHTSNRSLRAEQLAKWVNHVLEGDAESALALGVTEKFPIFLSRNLNETRSKLQEQAIGTNRHGLVGSSGAMRLRTEGLEPSATFHAEYPWEHWYLGEPTDVRSSYRCEVFATEFEIQGLELDWIGLCWGGDFIWNNSRGWELRALRHGRQSKWTAIKSNEKQTYRRNAYRVLLTRARQGMIIFVPMGNEKDQTNRPEEFETTAQYLLRCGVTLLGNIPATQPFDADSIFPNNLGSIRCV
jgi:hypothetical protein